MNKLQQQQKHQAMRHAHMLSSPWNLLKDLALWPPKWLIISKEDHTSLPEANIASQRPLRRKYQPHHCSTQLLVLKLVLWLVQTYSFHQHSALQTITLLMMQLMITYMETTEINAIRMPDGLLPLPIGSKMKITKFTLKKNHQWHWCSSCPSSFLWLLLTLVTK
jgi:hypothetical protein